METWPAYRPTAKTPWTISRVVHLHRRAGYAATWREVQRDLRDGPTLAIDRLVQGKARLEGVANDFESTAKRIEDAAVASTDSQRLRAWWFYRLLSSPDPLGEKLTLLWHNHFATSNLKVQNLNVMRGQNNLLRRHARDSFGTLLKAAIHDPAILIWLDASSNRKGNPNENLAREIMELFTLGIGNYTESDVKEAARALTGWTVKNGAYHHDATIHDDGPKTILQHEGKWDGDDLVRILLQHPATARRVAWRVCDLLCGEGALDPDSLDELAAGLRAHDLNIGWCVETVLRSQKFFSEDNIRARVSSPTEFMIGVVHCFECYDPPPSTMALAEWSARLGQDLFYPPNVGGWSGGRDWLTGAYVVARAQFAEALVQGRLHSQQAPLDITALTNKHKKNHDLEGVVTLLEELILGAPFDATSRQRILSLVENLPGTFDSKARSVAVLMLSSAQAQLT